MTLINKWWKRFLVSAIIGGITSEIVSIQTAGKVELNAFIIAIVLYLILSVVYGVIQRK